MLRKSTDGWISSLINRRFSSRITNLILEKNWQITPNQMSFISFLVGVLAFPFYLLKVPWIAGILFRFLLFWTEWMGSSHAQEMCLQTGELFRYDVGQVRGYTGRSWAVSLRFLER